MTRPIIPLSAGERVELWRLRSRSTGVLGVWDAEATNQVPF